MSDDRLRAALRDAPVDDPGARARSLRVVRAAYREAEPARGRRRGRRRVAALALVVVCAAVAAAAASTPGDAVARWVRDVLGVGRDDARPALVRVPGGGRLLVSSAGGAWAVSADGSRRRLGGYAGASWSPHGRFAVAWRGGELWAVEPGGRVRWSLARPRRISAARWGPVDGYRIAYLAGARLRVVNGDGTGDRPLARARAAVAPAWRPDRAHVLAYADASGRVRVVAVDSGRELWRTRAVAGIRQLAWSPDGARLLVATGRRLVLLGRSGRRLAQRRLASDDVAWAPRGGRVAIVRGGEVVVADPAGRGRPRVLFTGPGRFGPVAWSPSGRRLLVPWPEADQWLFLDARRGDRTTAVANIARQFGRFPERVEWCCAK